MTDDRLLRDLGALARERREAERARWDERWDRLAAGTLTPEEEVELKALAETSPEAREAWEAFRPLGADFQARVVDAIDPPPPILLFRRAVVWTGLAAAVAASLFFLVRGPGLAPLPAYTFDELNGDQDVRGAREGPSGKVPVFDPESRLTLVVRPPNPVTTPVEAKAFLAHGAGLLPWEPGSASPGGSFRFEGGLSGLQPGLWTAWVVVGRPGRIPTAGELQAALRAGRTRTADWQAISRDLRIGTRASP